MEASPPIGRVYADEVCSRAVVGDTVRFSVGFGNIHAVSCSTKDASQAAAKTATAPVEDSIRIFQQENAWKLGGDKAHRGFEKLATP